MSSSEWGDIRYYAFKDCCPIWTKLYDGLPRNEFGSTIFIIHFTGQDLESPKQEPIGLYYYAGIRRYLWRDQYWNEYNIDHRYFLDRTKQLLRDEKDRDNAITFRKLLDMITCLSFNGHWDQDLGHHYRVVYEINQR